MTIVCAGPLEVRSPDGIGWSSGLSRGDESLNRGFAVLLSLMIARTVCTGKMPGNHPSGSDQKLACVKRFV